ncbi:XkdX family protein [Clostridium sp. BJN0001]|nr:XkdX family protein [Clostridium sp. BJN0001]
MDFWKMVFNLKIVDTEYLKQVVITEKSPYGDITTEQYKEITGEDFIKLL